MPTMFPIRNLFSSSWDKKRGPSTENGVQGGLMKLIFINPLHPRCDRLKDQIGRLEYTLRLWLRDYATGGSLRSVRVTERTQGGL
jgi:hypothetical protein